MERNSYYYLYTRDSRKNRCEITVPAVMMAKRLGIPFGEKLSQGREDFKTVIKEKSFRFKKKRKKKT